MSAIPAGYKQTEVGVIPEDWEVMPFTQATDLITCGIAATPQYVPESRGYPFLSSTNVKDGRIVWSGYKYIRADLHRQLYRNNPPKKGDILYSRVGTFGEAAVVDVDFEFSVYVSLTLIKPGKPLDSFFLMQLLNSESYKRRAKDQIYLGGGVGNLNVDVVRRYPIVVPPIPEQRAIASALSDVDALLAKLDQFIAKRRDLKQAAMQQLLTGQTRLPGFSGGWEVKRLRDVAEVSKGSQLHSDDTSAESDFPHYNGGISPSSYTQKANAPADTIAISEGGNSCGYVQFITQSFWCGGHCYAVVPKGIDKRFLYHALKGRQQTIMGLRVGSGLPNVQKTALKAFSFELPKTAEEQTAIATVLSDMDAELAALKARRDKTSALKQGMMQELLTGRIRLV